MSSLNAFPWFHDTDDWQLIKSDRPYGGSKYQIDLISTELNRRALREPSPSIRHFTVDPGLVHTAFSLPLLGPFLHKISPMAYYVVCLAGIIIDVDVELTLLGSSFGFRGSHHYHLGWGSIGCARRTRFPSKRPHLHQS